MVLRSMRKLVGLLAGLLVIIFSSCDDSSTPEDVTIAEVMGDVVTQIYAEGAENDFSDKTQDEVLEWFTEEEKKVLATKYWNFNVDQPVEVYIAQDQRQEEDPFWLNENGFQKTDQIVKNSHVTYNLWKKDFPAGLVELGINGLDRHRYVYFVIVKPKEGESPLFVEPVFPAQQKISVFEEGAFTYHDWDELVITDLPSELEGSVLLPTYRGRSREAHLIGGFRQTEFPSSDTIDHIVQTWSGDPRTSLTIGWRTSVDVDQSELKYWKEGSTDTMTISGDAETLEDRMLSNDRYIKRFTADITGLTPGTTYNYRLSTSAYDSPSYQFVTDDGSDQFTFGWFGDVHNHPNWGELLQKVDGENEDIRFYLQAGDLVNTGLFRDDWDRLIQYSGNVFRNKPFMAVPGNHDSQEGLPPLRFLEYLKYPHNGPYEEEYGMTYTFRYGNTEFFMMDCVTTSVEDQAEWLEEQLQASDAVFKIASFHFSAFTPHEDYDDIVGSWVPLFEKYGVDLVFTGHFHYYQRIKAHGAKLSEKGTPTYIMSVGTTMKNEDVAVSTEYEKTLYRDHLVQIVNVNGKRLELVAQDSDGNEIDRYVIDKN